MVQKFIVIFSALALLLAPVVVAATHSSYDVYGLYGGVGGPDAVIAPGSAAKVVMAAHWTAHSHDVTTDEGGAGPIDFLLQGHDATDHEHQLQAFLDGRFGVLVLLRKDVGRRIGMSVAGVISDSPRRPPRERLV